MSLINRPVDIISPVWRLFWDYKLGPACHFGIPVDVGSQSVKRLLQSKGVKSWGYTQDGAILEFSVRVAQAKWSYRLLLEARVPVSHVPEEAMDSYRKPKWYQRGPARWVWAFFSLWKNQFGP